MIKSKKVLLFIIAVLIFVMLIIFAGINIGRSSDEEWKNIKFYDLEILMPNKWDTDASDLELKGIVRRGYYTPQHKGIVLFEKLDSRKVDVNVSLNEYIHFEEQTKLPNKRIDNQEVETHKINNSIQYKTLDIRKINGSEWKYHFGYFLGNDGEDRWRETYIKSHNNYYYIVRFSYEDIDNGTIEMLRKCKDSLVLTENHAYKLLNP